jgi:hypothetical protein
MTRMTAAAIAALLSTSAAQAQDGPYLNVHGRQGHRDPRGHGFPARDAEGVPMLLRHYAVRECVAARLKALRRACRAGRVNGLHRHGTAGERAQRRREGYPFHHFVGLRLER